MIASMVEDGVWALRVWRLQAMKAAVGRPKYLEWNSMPQFAYPTAGSHSHSKIVDLRWAP